MKLYQLFEAVDFDEIMPAVVEMFPGTGKFRPQLHNAYNIMRSMKPVASKKSIRYVVAQIPNSDHSYIGASDTDFQSTWPVLLGKEVTRGKGASINDVEMAANCLVSAALLGQHPKAFEEDYNILRSEQA